jgi:hypothetical protein
MLSLSGEFEREKTGKLGGFEDRKATGFWEGFQGQTRMSAPPVKDRKTKDKEEIQDHGQWSRVRDTFGGA